MNSNAGYFRINSPFVVSMALVATLVAGCAGGSLTTREKGAGIGALAALLRAGLSVRRCAIRRQARPSAVR